MYLLFLHDISLSIVNSYYMPSLLDVIKLTKSRLIVELVFLFSSYLNVINLFIEDFILDTTFKLPINSNNIIIAND